MSNSSDQGRKPMEEACLGHAHPLVLDLMHGVARESLYLGDELVILGDDLCRPPEKTSPSDRIVWMQSFDRLEQAARAQARFASWLANCLATGIAPSMAEISNALEVIPLRDMKERLARIAGLLPNDHSAYNPGDEEIWSAASPAGDDGGLFG